MNHSGAFALCLVKSKSKRKPNKTLFAAAIAVAVMSTTFSHGQQTAQGRRPEVGRGLQAIRKGDKVELTWNQPHAIAGRPSAEARICRVLSSTLSASVARVTTCGEPVGKVSLHKSTPLTNTTLGTTSATVAMRYTESLPKSLQESGSLQFAIYTVEVFDDHGRSAGFSNSAPVLLSPSPKVNGLHSELDSRGVYLIWEDEIESHPGDVEFDYRVERREKGSSRRFTVPYLRAVVHQKEGDRWSAVDTGLEWGKTYIYQITPVAKVYSQDGKLFAGMEGEASSLEVIAHDVFPPAVPQSLLALVGRRPGNKFVDLTWAPNAEKNLASYNIYRREAGREPARIHTGPSSILSFQDNDVAGGRTYFYCLSAVGANGNESAKSSEVTAVVP